MIRLLSLQYSSLSRCNEFKMLNSRRLRKLTVALLVATVIFITLLHLTRYELRNLINIENFDTGFYKRSEEFACKFKSEPRICEIIL